MFEFLTKYHHKIEIIDNENNSTTIRDITEYLQKNEPEIDINIVNSSIRHYRENGLVKRKHNPYKRPFKYILSKKGIEQLEWLEDEKYLEFID